MWEDFLEGGTWIIHFKRRDWYQACVGEEFEDTNVIGVVLSLRERRNLLEIWIKDRRESEKLRIGERLVSGLLLHASNTSKTTTSG
jgi:translation initiation factor 4E